MEQPEIIEALCRDGAHARIQEVEYFGPGGGRVLFGHRTIGKTFGDDGLRREAGDIWGLDGFWREDRTPHDFDLIASRKLIHKKPNG